MIDGGLDLLVEKCISKPGESGPLVEYSAQRGATLAGRPKIDGLLQDALWDEGLGPRMDLLLKFGARLDHGCEVINILLESIYVAFGPRPRVDWLLQKGAFWPRGHAPRRGMLDDYQMQLMLLDRPNKRRKLLIDASVRPEAL